MVGREIVKSNGGGQGCSRGESRWDGTNCSAPNLKRGPALAAVARPGVVDAVERFLGTTLGPVRPLESVICRLAEGVEQAIYSHTGAVQRLSSRLVTVVMVMASPRYQTEAVGQVQSCGVGGSDSGRRAVG